MRAARMNIRLLDICGFNVIPYNRIVHQIHQLLKPTEFCPEIVGFALINLVSKSRESNSFKKH